MRRALSLACLVAAPLALACGARPFDPPSSVQTLRVIGVRADHPTPPPGADVTLELLAYDGSPHATRADGTQRPIETVWLGGCADPDGDLYYECYDQLGPALAALRAGTPSPLVGRGSTYTWHVPEDLISRRAGVGKSKYKYGLAYVFFAACAGKVVATDATDATSPRLGCVDDEGAAVSADGFVYGYYPLYAYPGVDNANPIVTGGTFDGAAPPAKRCAGDADCDVDQACGSAGTCLRVVAPCTPGACAALEVRPQVDPASSEPDPLQSAVAGEARNEVVFVDYLTSAGAVRGGATNVVIDPTRGPREGFGASWTPPDVAVGEARIWALVRDNRSGLTWWSVDVVVR